jgi:hypothetical protein
MGKDLTNLDVLSTRSGFNSAVRQIKKTIGVAENVGSSNLGDLLYELGDEDLSGERAGLLLRMLLVDKLGYKTASSNLGTVVSDPSILANEFSKWNGVDLIAAYHHPEMGLLIANPKVKEELAGFGQLNKRELLVIYAGKGSSPADSACEKAALLALELFMGSKITVPPALLKGSFGVRKLKKTAAEKEAPAPKASAKKPSKASASAPKGKKASKPTKPAPAAAPEAQRIAAPVVTATAAAAAPAGPVKMTPRYAVVVQNELFHNGNVESWKRIIASYKAKYPAFEVFIYYDGERILDINSLFKWGKVKHGSAIEFAVAGSEIKDVAKLQRYLAQGASQMFEAFLHGPVNNVLKLFG